MINDTLISLISLSLSLSLSHTHTHTHSSHTFMNANSLSLSFSCSVSLFLQLQGILDWVSWRMPADIKGPTAAAICSRCHRKPVIYTVLVNSISRRYYQRRQFIVSIVLHYHNQILWIILSLVLCQLSHASYLMPLVS